jgi:aminoacyl tRNA synthase complex-interacting multifunctional protein 1
MRRYSTVTRLPSLLNLKVGKIIQCNFHPDADKLYVSKINVGTENEVQVCSGLVNYIDRSKLLNKEVVLLTNLKPSKMRGVLSQAMVLATESQDGSVVELINPPKDASVGDQLYFGDAIEKDPARLKSKVWQEIQAHLFTNGNGEAVFKTDNEELVLKRENGTAPATSDTLKNTIIR